MNNSNVTAGERSTLLNPHLLLLQTKLTSPNSHSGGRWAVFNPLSRKAAVAVGKDCMPKLVALATELSSSDAERRRHAIAQVSQPYYQSLLDFGIVTAHETTMPPLRSSERRFVGRYHACVHNFDWFDYFDPEWRQKDDYRMQQYQRQSSPPPNFTSMEGELTALPDVDLTSADESLTLLHRVSAVLRWSLGPIGTVPGGPYLWLRRTSPSGGARHPTDGYLVHNGALEGIAAGAYWYDSKRHGLVLLPDVRVSGIQPDEVRLVFTSHVARPMWRYRDPWSYRPMLIDVGHVMETASLVADHFGLAALAIPTPEGMPITKHHMANADVAALSLAASNRRPQVPPPPGEYMQSPSDTSMDGAVITSPFVYFVFRDGELVARSAEGAESELPVSPDAFVLLSHCLPSTRDDRITTRNHLLEHFPGVSAGDLEELERRRILMSRVRAHAAYSATWPWVQHGWYMSLLAHVEGLGLRAYHAVTTAPLAQTTGSGLVRSLLSRRTCRTYSPHPLEPDALNAALQDALATLPESARLDTDVYVWFNAEARRAESNAFFYDWRANRLAYREGRHVCRADIRRLAIGQLWAAAAGSAVLLRTRMGGAEGYIDAITRLGRIGQRICLAATAAGLGVFETPAVKEPVAAELLGHSDSAVDSDIYYFLAVGHSVQIAGDFGAVSA
ncbi:nitroreductase family protein [Ramlibacter sp. MMS24-I3-19]|uniref:nitroreductase family protein n=1 Tax=Ramlibacter sp. MMS24-I3-19 TaxID=3416606 RepID=UPI003D07C833